MGCTMREYFTFHLKFLLFFLLNMRNKEMTAFYFGEFNLYNKHFSCCLYNKQKIITNSYSADFPKESIQTNHVYFF